MRAAVSETGPQLKPWIEAIHAYVPGQAAAPDGRPLAKLSANENPLGTSPLALAARSEAGAPSLYPDPDSHALRRAIGELHGIDPALIVCGTGSDELLTLAAQAFVAASREHNRAVRADFVAALETLGNHGIRPLPSEANFVLVLFDGALTAAAALAGLAERGFAVRHLPGQGLPHGLRITIGTAEQMEAIAEGLRQMAQSAS
jgi:histidinol-phosphate/aromatic aminotransferase/cobyric acid decarboxylase-like protein